MFEKILYPIDFSEYAEKLAGALNELKNAGLKEVVLAHTVDFRTAGGMVKEMLVGSVCARVVRHTTRPVLVIRKDIPG